MTSTAAVGLARSVFLGLALGAMSLPLAAPAGANPTVSPVPVDWTLGGLPESYVRHGRRSDADRLVLRFAEQGFTGADSRMIEYLDRHADRFKPLVLRAQTPPHHPDLGLQAWYRAHASETERGRMNAVLRAWFEHPLTRPEAWHGSDGTRTVLTRIPDPPLLAAQVLGDARDSLALPAIRAFRSRLEQTLPRDARGRPDWPSVEDELRSPHVLLDQALLRIEDPPRAGFLCAGPDGRLEVHRRLEDLESMELFTAERYLDDSSVVVDRERTMRIWDLLSAGSEIAPPRPDLPRPGLRLRFRDGLVARLALAESGHFYYWENCRVGYEPIAHVHVAALYDSLRRMLRTGPGPGMIVSRDFSEIRIFPDSVRATPRVQARERSTPPRRPGSR